MIDFESVRYKICAVDRSVHGGKLKLTKTYLRCKALRAVSAVASASMTELF
jgi:hypothetical protein